VRSLPHDDDDDAGQTFGKLRAADEIIDEGHFIGKALGEGLNGFRPIVELMNSNFGICEPHSPPSTSCC